MEQHHVAVFEDMFWSRQWIAVCVVCEIPIPFGRDEGSSEQNARDYAAEHGTVSTPKWKEEECSGIG